MIQNCTSMVLWSLCAAMLTCNLRADDSTAFQWFGGKITGGTWVRTDASGKKQQHAYAWALGRRFLIFENRTADQPELSVIGVDPANGVQTWWNFASSGEASVSRTNEKIMGLDNSEGSFESDNGKTVGSFQSKYVGSDRLEITVDGKIDGVSVSGLQVWERTRDDNSRFSLASNPPNTIPPAMSLLARTLKYSSATGQLPTGEKYASVMAVDWIFGGKFLRLTESLVLENHHTANYMFILGTDTKTGQTTGWEFDSDGAVGKFVVAPDGKSLKGKVQLTARDAMEYQGTLSVDSTGALVYQATGKIGDAAAKPYHVTSRKMQSP